LHTGPPLATIDPESVEIRAHQSMTLSCVTNATLATNITWSKRVSEQDTFLFMFDAQQY